MERKEGLRPQIASELRKRMCVVFGHCAAAFGRIAEIRSRRTADPGSRLRVLDRLSVGPKQSIAIIEWQKQRFLITTGAGEASPSVIRLQAPAKIVSTPPLGSTRNRRRVRHARAQRAGASR